jgi:hypothetical protein
VTSRPPYDIRRIQDLTRATYIYDARRLRVNQVKDVQQMLTGVVNSFYCAQEFPEMCQSALTLVTQGSHVHSTNLILSFRALRKA